jgi:hypothetical protein
MNENVSVGDRVKVAVPMYAPEFGKAIAVQDSMEFYHREGQEPTGMNLVTVETDSGDVVSVNEKHVTKVGLTAVEGEQR